MARMKEGDRVRVVTRPLTEQDRKVYSLFEHMLGLTGVVENVYSDDEVAVKIDLDALPKVAEDVHKEATRRMRAKFADSIGEEQKKSLTKEELEFVPHYVLLLRAADLERV